MLEYSSSISSMSFQDIVVTGINSQFWGRHHAAQKLAHMEQRRGYYARRDVGDDWDMTMPEFDTENQQRDNYRAHVGMTNIYQRRWLSQGMKDSIVDLARECVAEQFTPANQNARVRNN